VGHGSMLGNGLQLLSSGGAVISGSPSGYDNVINLKLKSGGGLAVDSDGISVTAGGEFGAGSGIEIIASPHKVVGLVANSLTGNKLTAFSGTDTTLLSANNHIFGSMDTDNSDPVHGGLTIVGYNEGTGGNVGGHSQLVLQNAHTESTDGLCDEIGVFRLENEGDLCIQMGKKQENNTDQIYNGANGVVYDKMKFYREGGALLQLGAFDGTDAVLANHESNVARGSAGDNTFTCYNDTDDMMFEMIVGRNNLTSGTDLASNALTNPSGFQIVHKQGGDTILNNNKTKAIIFHIGGAEKARFHDNGFLGIGRTAPECPISVTGAGAISPTGVIVSSSSNWGYWVSTTNSALNAPGVFGGGAGNTPNLSLSAAFSGSIASLAFHTASDSRIKTDVSECDVSACYNKFNQLELKEYHYIDPATRKENKTIGYIAQEVDSVDSGFVNKTHKPIPNEMRNIDNPVWEDNKLMLDLSFNDNETGICVFWVSNSDVIAEYEREVKYEDGGFVFDKQWERIFFYGREVNDFNSVKKDSIMALLHGAVKYIDNDVRVLETHDTSHNNNITELQNKVNLLETENNGLLERTQVLEDKNVEQDTKINTLETLLQELTARVSFNETALKGLIN